MIILLRFPFLSRRFMQVGFQQCLCIAEKQESSHAKWPPSHLCFGGRRGLCPQGEREGSEKQGYQRQFHSRICPGQAKKRIYPIWETSMKSPFFKEQGIHGRTRLCRGEEERGWERWVVRGAHPTLAQAQTQPEAITQNPWCTCKEKGARILPLQVECLPKNYQHHTVSSAWLASIKRAWPELLLVFGHLTHPLSSSPLQRFVHPWILCCLENWSLK